MDDTESLNNMSRSLSIIHNQSINENDLVLILFYEKNLKDESVTIMTTKEENKPMILNK